MPLVRKVLSKAHAIACEVLNIILLAPDLALDSQAAVFDAVLDVSTLLVYLRAVEVSLGEVGLQDAHVDAPIDASVEGFGGYLSRLEKKPVD